MIFNHGVISVKNSYLNEPDNSWVSDGVILQVIFSDINNDITNIVTVI